MPDVTLYRDGVPQTTISVTFQAGGTEGKVRKFRELRSDMDTYVLSAVSGTQANRDFLRRFERLRVWMNGSSYPCDKALAQSPRWMPTCWVYRDVMVATYVSNTTVADEHYLWDKPPTDSTRKRLYINFGSHDQYAADLGNPNTRKRFIDGVVPHAQKAGGVWVDDVNFYMPRVVSDVNGTFVRPWNPRTNAPMTDDDWATYMLTVLQELKARLPDPLEVVINTVPYHGPGILNIPQAKAALGVVDGWEIEGNTVGQDAAPYQAQIDYAHSVGTFVVHDIQQNPNGHVYPEAVCLAFNAGRDYYGHVDMKPTVTWDALWDKDLGASAGPAVKGSDGIWRRSFERGSVTVNPANKTASIT